MSDTSYATVLPPAVRAAAARSEQLQAELAAQIANPTVETGREGGGSAPDNPPPETPAQPDSAPQGQHTRQPASPDQGGQQGNQQGDPWQARYETLQGKYNTETRALRDQLGDAQGRIASLERALSTIQAQPAPQPAPAPVAQPAPIPDTDAEEYGSDLITAAQRWAMAAVSPELNRLRQQLAELQGNTTRVSQSVAKSAIDAALDRLEPDWQTTNTDPGFITWLGVRDQFSGATRKDLADDAYARGDANRVASFFRAYKSETGHTSHVANPQDNQFQTPTGAGQPDLADFAAPGAARGASRQPGALPKRTYARAEIQRFYQDVTKGRYAGRDAEKQQMEAELTLAISEGRVR